MDDWREVPEIIADAFVACVSEEDILKANGLRSPLQAAWLPARIHREHEAPRTCAEGLKLDAEDAELWFRKGAVHRHRGESAEAERSWRRILDLKRPEQFCSFDQQIHGHVTRRNLATLPEERGDHAEAQRLCAEVLAECPGDREATAKLGRLNRAAPR